MNGFKKWIEGFDFESHPKIPNLVQTIFDKRKRYKIIVIDVQKFDRAWSEDVNMYLPPGGKGRNYISVYNPDDPNYNRYHHAEKSANQFKEKNKEFEMPTVGLQGNIPIFNDGRHRFAYFRDLGVKNLPISVPGRNSRKMKELFGV